MQATIIAAVHNEFSPPLAALEGRINVATDHLGTVEQSTNMLRGKINDLHVCVASVDGNINGLEIGPTAGLSSLEAVSALSSHAQP